LLKNLSTGTENVDGKKTPFLIDNKHLWGVGSGSSKSFRIRIRIPNTADRYGLLMKRLFFISGGSLFINPVFIPVRTVSKRHRYRYLLWVLLFLERNTDTVFWTVIAHGFLLNFQDLDTSLKKLGSRLFVIKGSPEEIFPKLIRLGAVRFVCPLYFIKKRIPALARFCRKQSRFCARTKINFLSILPRL
jgi:hypothetical protein